jgi:nucleoside phosphorylase
MSLIDYLVLAPLRQEWREVRRVLAPAANRDNEVQHDAQTYIGWTQRARTNQYRGDYLLAGAQMALWTPGGALASAIAKTAVDHWHPRRVLLVGIAGSIAPDRVQLGDVVVPPEVHGYEIMDAVGDSFTMRATKDKPGTLDLSRISAFQDDAKSYQRWQESCLDDATNPKLRKAITRPPELHLEPIASGNKVVKSVEFANRLRNEVDQWIVAVEMEARAVHQAVYAGTHRSDVLTVRGVSDYANGDKSRLDGETKGAWRTWAAANAARLVKAILRRGVSAPISDAYSFDLTRGPYSRFALVNPRIAFRHVGSQQLAFPGFLRRVTVTPEIEVRVRATTDRGTAPAQMRGLCVVRASSTQIVQSNILPNGVMSFRITASEMPYECELLLAFAEPARRLAFGVRDSFGRKYLETLNIP